MPQSSCRESGSWPLRGVDGVPCPLNGRGLWRKGHTFLLNWCHQQRHRGASLQSQSKVEKEQVEQRGRTKLEKKNRRRKRMLNVKDSQFELIPITAAHCMATLSGTSLWRRLGHCEISHFILSSSNDQQAPSYIESLFSNVLGRNTYFFSFLVRNI